MTAALHAHHLCLERRDQKGGFKLTVPEIALNHGETLAILGGNGAGKSTLLRILAGLEKIDQGRLELPAGGLVTMVFQRPIAFAGSVAHNIRIALRAQGVHRGDLEQRVSESLGHFGIEPLAERRASRLSGGELRRLALARAFALSPSVLLLDEPFDDLDFEAQEALSQDLRERVAKTGVAVAFVTHDVRRAALLCDRMAILERGRLAQIAPRDQVLNQPASPSIARRVGMNNIFPAKMTESGWAEAGPGLRLPTHHNHPPGTAVWVGLRPEHLKLEREPRPEAGIGSAQICSIVSDRVLCTVELECGGQRMRTHLVAGRGLAREIEVGETLTLSIRPEDVHILQRA
ncbi:MAG: ABC transporter ATP-binding protein [Myxococcota bacterium]|nr:ABC transporter ATP-binding protein [Myxococcota bacterium]